MPAVCSAAPTVDPNCPKPEGSTITPTVGEQLVVSTSINVEIAVTIIHAYTKRGPVCCASVLAFGAERCELSNSVVCTEQEVIITLRYIGDAY